LAFNAKKQAEKVNEQQIEEVKPSAFDENEGTEV
tara:strand:- start:134 stop:235 length:102 start_codon:yes stop_codon:yes gene_type:complete